MHTTGRSSFEPILPGDSGGPDNNGFSFVIIRNFLVRQWRLIALITVATIGLGALYASLTPSRFTATTDMIIDTKRIGFNQAELSAENRSIDDPAVESEIETTKSEKVALLVINRLQLTKDPEFVGQGQQLTQRLWTLFTKKSESEEEAIASKEALVRRALDTFKGNLRVTRLGRSYVEQISYTSLDPNKAATIANAVADAYIEDQLQAKFDATRRASIWLQNRIGELKEQASDAYKAVQDFKSENGIIIGVDGKLASEVELDQLGAALAKARADTTQAQAKLDRISRILEQRKVSDLNIPDPVVTDALSNPVITKLRQEFLDNQNKESEWSARYGPDHIAARNLRAQMAALQRAIWDEITRIAESYKSELQIARDQENSIDRRMTEVFQKSSSTRQSQVKLRELETSANTYRNIYETFLTRYTQAVQQQSFPSTEARIVTLASPPSTRSSPKVGLILALSGIIGIGFGTMAALMREQMNRRLYTRDHVEVYLGTTCLAVLPKVPLRKIEKLNKSGSSGRSRSVALLGEDQPFSATAEAMRYIKVAIDLFPNGAKVVGFVSALPGEGKTTVAASVASAIAKSGARTLLIDADLRNPSMSRSLGYSDAPGILNLVTERVDYRTLVINDPRFKFDFLTASARVKTARSSDILTSEAMKALLKAAKADYDYVIVDLPPILPVVDVKAAAGLFDAFVMIVEWGNTRIDEAVKAMGTSSTVAERMLGVVLNKADEGAMRRIEGYSDRRYTYYSSERNETVKA